MCTHNNKDFPHSPVLVDRNPSCALLKAAGTSFRVTPFFFVKITFVSDVRGRSIIFKYLKPEIRSIGYRRIL